MCRAILVIPFLGIMPGCKKDPDAPGPGTEPAKAPAKVSAACGTAKREGPIAWIEDDYAAALACAKEKNLPLVLDLWAPWCHTCLSMKSTVFMDGSFQPDADKFVFAALDTDREDSAPVVAKFPLSAWPTLPIPRVLLPGMLAAARLVVVRWHLHSAYPLLQAGDHLLVRVSRRPRGDGLHWCVWGAAEPALLHLHHHPGSDSYTLVDPATGREETRPAGSLAFGLPDGDAGARHGAEYQPLRIVGPVVGRLTFWEDGTRLPPASRSSVSSLVGLA